MYNLFNKIDFSLIIPTHNKAKLLKECLTSILAQDYPKERYEVIICDDGSNDDTREAAEYFIKKNRNILYFYQKHKGISAARNLGIMNARGEYLGFLADDYTLDGEYLKKTLSMLQKNEDIMVMRFGISIQNNARLSRIQHFIYRFSLRNLLNKESDCSVLVKSSSRETDSCIRKSYYLPASGGAVFRKDIFTNIGLFDQALIVGEDTDMGLKLKTAGIPVFYCHYPLIRRSYDLGLRGCMKKFFRNGRNLYSFLRKYPDYHNYIFNGFSIKNYILFLKERICLFLERCVACLTQRPLIDTLIWPVFILLFEVSYLLGVFYSVLFPSHREPREE